MIATDLAGTGLKQTDLDDAYSQALAEAEQEEKKKQETAAALPVVIPPDPEEANYVAPRPQFEEQLMMDP